MKFAASCLFLIGWLAAFSFADAAVVYSQPYGSNATSSVLSSTRSLYSSEFTASEVQQVGGGSVTFNLAGDTGDGRDFVVYMRNITDNSIIATTENQRVFASSTSWTLPLTSLNQG